MLSKIMVGDIQRKKRCDILNAIVLWDTKDGQGSQPNDDVAIQSEQNWVVQPPP